MPESTSPQNYEEAGHIVATPEAIANSLERIVKSLELENYKLTENSNGNPHITAASVALNHVMVAIMNEIINLKEG